MTTQKGNKKIVGLIPARKHSQRVPRKNIRQIHGKALIEFTFEAAKESRLLDRIILSTDDEEAVALGKKATIEVPFLRPQELAENNSPDKDVIVHLIEWLRENERYVFDYLVYLRPTTPLKTGRLIDLAIEKILQNPTCSAIRSVTRTEGIFHPYWMFREENGRLISFIKGIQLEKYYQRQLLPPCFRLNGVVDVIAINSFRESNSLYGNNIGFLEISEEQSLDIDNEFDVKLFEFLLTNNDLHLKY